MDGMDKPTTGSDKMASDSKSNNPMVGSKVRSFDFESRDLDGERACYVEGEVVEVGVVLEGCQRYRIRVDKRVFGGKVLTGPRVEKEVFPPVNGTASWLGKPIDVVVCIDDAAEAIDG
jgi:hypothetical protein